MILNNINRNDLVNGVTKSATTRIEQKTEAQLSVNDFKEGLEYKVFIIGKGLYSVVNYNGTLYYNEYTDTI